MSTNSFLSRLLIQINLNQASVSPEVFVEIPEVNDFPSFGESTPLEDVTHFQSTSREYIGGLADGDEFSMTCNRVHRSPDIQGSLIALKGLTRTLKVTERDASVSPNTTKVYRANVVILGWSLAPGVGTKQSITFNFKITGGVSIT